MHSNMRGEMSNAMQLEHLDFAATSGVVFQCSAARTQYSLSSRFKGPYWMCSAWIAALRFLVFSSRSCVGLGQTRCFASWINFRQFSINSCTFINSYEKGIIPLYIALLLQVLWTQCSLTMNKHQFQAAGEQRAIKRGLLEILLKPVALTTIHQQLKRAANRFHQHSVDVRSKN